MISGITNGMVMQRGTDNTCEIWVTSDEVLTEVLTHDGQSARAEMIDGRYRITGIRCGGPYSLNVNGHVYNDIYVGDVWILAGQSNMQGCGRDIDIEYNENPAIRAYYMQNEWGIADNPLHEPGRAVYKVHTEVLGAKRGFSKRCVGPGLYFAKRMYDLTSVPQGLICCAHADTSLSQWDPDSAQCGADKSLYAAMLERFKSNGSNIRGVFWGQGCNDARIQFYKDYTEKTLNLFKCMRRDFGRCVPIVYMQISRCVRSAAGGDIRPDTWNSVQEQQRTLCMKIENADVIPTVAYELSDRYHLSGKSQKIIGRSAAESMFNLIHGKLYGCLGGIKLEGIELFRDEIAPDELSSIIVTYKNVKGSLSGGERVMGFSLSETPDNFDGDNIISCTADGNRVIIVVGVAAVKLSDMYLSYGIGFDPPCNILDGEKRSLPMFGPILIKSVL